MKLDNVDVKTLAAVIGLTSRQIQRLAQDGILPRAGRGSYDLPACVQAWGAHLSQGKVTKGLVTERQRLITAQARRAELEIKRAEGDVIDVNDVQAVFNAVMQALAYELGGISSRVAAEVASETDPALIQGILFEEHRRIRESTADRLAGLADRGGQPANQ